MYGDHCEEFVCGYWGLKRFSVKFCHLLKFPEVSASPFSNCNVLAEKITVFKMTVFLGWNGNSPQELPACRRLLFPNKGNRRRLHAGNTGRDK